MKCVKFRAYCETNTETFVSSHSNMFVDSYSSLFTIGLCYSCGWMSLFFILQWSLAGTWFNFHGSFAVLLVLFCMFLLFCIYHNALCSVSWFLIGCKPLSVNLLRVVSPVADMIFVSIEDFFFCDCLNFKSLNIREKYENVQVCQRNVYKVWCEGFHCLNSCRIIVKNETTLWILPIACSL